MSLRYGMNFKFSNDEMKKYLYFMDCDTTKDHHPQQDHHNSGGIMRYCSAPTSLFASLVDGTKGFNLSNNGGGGSGLEDYRFIRSSSLEVETILSRFMVSCNGTIDSGSQNLQEGGFGERPVKQEMVESVQQQNGYCNQYSLMVNMNSIHFGFWNICPSASTRKAIEVFCNCSFRREWTGKRRRATSSCLMCLDWPMRSQAASYRNDGSAVVGNGR